MTNPLVDYNTIQLKKKWINSFLSNFKNSDYKPNIFIILLSRIFSGIFRKFFIISDPWILESKNVCNHLSNSNKKYDIIYAVVKPWSMAKLGLKIVKNLMPQAKLIYDIGDPLTYNSARSDFKFVKRWKFKFENRFLNHADHIIVTNEGTKQHYVNVFNLKPENISIIPQGANLALIKASNKGTIKKHDKIIKLMYAGVFYENLRDPRPFFEILRETNDIGLFVYGSMLPIFTEGYDFIKFKPKIAYEKLISSYTECDILVFVDNKFGMQTSGKIYELLSMQKPILFLYSNTDSPVYKLAQAYEHILFIKLESKIDISVIDQIKNFAKEKMDFNYNTDQFSWESRAKQVSEIFNTI